MQAHSLLADAQTVDRGKAEDRARTRYLKAVDAVAVECLRRCKVVPPGGAETTSKCAPRLCLSDLEHLQPFHNHACDTVLACVLPDTVLVLMLYWLAEKTTMQ